MVVDGVDADPPVVFPGDSTTVSVDVDADADELNYEWTGADDWQWETDEGASVELVAPDTYGETATVEVTVSDDFGNADGGDVEVATPENDGPLIEALSVDPESAIPGAIQEIDADVSHPHDHDLSFDWSIPDEWTAVDDGELPDGRIDLEAPDEHGVSGDIEVTVVDETDQEATASASIETESNPGPEIEALVVDEDVVDPGATTSVAVDAVHPLGHGLSYEWSVEDDDWAIIDDQDDEIEIEAPAAPEASTVVSVEVTDDYGEVDDDWLIVETPDNEAPVIETFEADEDVVDPGGRRTSLSTPNRRLASH